MLLVGGGLLPLMFGVVAGIIGARSRQKDLKTYGASGPFKSKSFFSSPMFITSEPFQRTDIRMKPLGPLITRIQVHGTRLKVVFYYHPPSIGCWLSGLQSITKEENEETIKICEIFCDTDDRKVHSA